MIASLVYLGVQIRSSTRAAKAAAYQQTLMGGRDITLAVVTHPDLFEALVRRWGLTDQGQIDRAREGFYFTAMMNNWENQVYQHDHVGGPLCTDAGLPRPQSELL